MAGGALAMHVPCMLCLTAGALVKATRIYEGDEADQYRCDNGHEFGMDYLRGPATESLWPPSPELEALVKR